MSIRRIFGEDIFISYARKDSSTYSSGLADELTKRGFSCFIDRLGSEANQVLPNSLRRKIRNATMLVIIGTKWSGTRDSVKDEIAEFKRTKRTIVPVDLDGSIYDAVWYNEIEGIAPEPENNLQALDDGNPSLAVLSRIEKAFRYLRRNQRLRFMTIGMVTILVALLAISGYAGRKAASELARAEQAKQEADIQRGIADEQTKAAEEAKKQAQQALRDADKQKEIAVAKTEEAARQSKIADESTKEAHRQQQIAATQAAAAERQLKISVGLSLASEGKRLWENDPMLGLRLDLEALSGLPEDDAASRKTVEKMITDMSAQGRVMKLGADGFGKPYFIENSQLFVLVRAEGPSELRRSDTGELVQTLPDKAAEEPPPWAAQGPYFIVKYEHAPSEVRRRDSGEVVASGNVERVETFDEAPFVLIKNVGSPDQLLPINRRGLLVTLPDNVHYLVHAPGVPWRLFFYESNELELRGLNLKRVVATYPNPKNWNEGIEIESSSDGSLFCVKDLTENVFLGFKREWAELRRMDSGEVVPLAGKVRNVAFSPQGPYFVVAYSDAPGEIRRTDSTQVVRLPKIVNQVAFGKHSPTFMVGYQDASGEMYVDPGAQPISLRRPVKLVEPERDLPYLKVTHESLSDIEYFNERTGARIETNPYGYHDAIVSHDKRSRLFIILVYSGSEKRYELRRLDSGEAVALPQPAVQITFVEGTPYLLIVYEGGNCELRQVEDGRVLPISFTVVLPASVDPILGNSTFAHVQFSPDLNTFVVYDNNKGAVFRAPTGEKLGDLSTGESVRPSRVVFSPDSKRFLVTYQRLAPQLRASDTGAVVRQILHWIGYNYEDEINFNSRSTCLAVTYQDGRPQLMRADNGEVLAPLAGGALLSSLEFSPSGDYAVLTFEDSRAELWNTGSVPRRVIELERNLTGFRFDEANNQLMVWHSDKRAYILDLRWISNVTSGSGRVPFERLIQSSCEAYKHHPLAQGILERYLVGESPRACQ